MKWAFQTTTTINSLKSTRICQCLAILYCTVLCTVYCTTLHHTTLPRHATPRHATPRHARPAAQRTPPHHTAAHRTAAHRTVPHHTTPYYDIRCKRAKLVSTTFARRLGMYDSSIFYKKTIKRTVRPRWSRAGGIAPFHLFLFISESCLPICKSFIS